MRDYGVIKKIWAKKLDNIQTEMLKTAVRHTINQKDLDNFNNAELEALIWLRDNEYLIVHKPSFGLSASGKGREYVRANVWYPKI
jgi:hypothetical protein